LRLCGFARDFFFLALVSCICLGCGANFHEDPERDDRREWGQESLPEAWCVGDGDGVIDSDEVVVAPEVGVTVAFTVNTADVVLEEPGGATSGDSDVEWDLSPVAPGMDELLWIGPSSIADRWYAEHFPIDAFDALLDGPSRTMGIYRLDEEEDALNLLGVASEQEGGDVLVYDPPVPLLRYPLADGDAWTPEDAAAEGVVDGEVFPQDLGADGTVYLVHTYDVAVDGAGVARLPAGDLDVLRVRIEHRQEAYNSIAGLFAADSSRATLFVAECLGVVARLRSQPDEVDADFVDATEVLRLGFDLELL